MNFSQETGQYAGFFSLALIILIVILLINAQFISFKLTVEIQTKTSLSIPDIHQRQDFGQVFRTYGVVAQTAAFPSPLPLLPGRCKRIDLGIKRPASLGTSRWFPAHVRVFMVSELEARTRPLSVARVQREKIALSRCRRNESPTTARREHKIRTLALSG